ncbi:hypothetical protein D0T23_05940 [Duganella sp. BJB475]|nr:hypothetical protein D0T23_05940 [Duganella sp. BJB475]RFP35896.1 hypothetical protein D0T21_05485 [Duganella sp. BJB476]
MKTLLFNFMSLVLFVASSTCFAMPDVKNYDNVELNEIPEIVPITKEQQEYIRHLLKSMLDVIEKRESWKKMMQYLETVVIFGLRIRRNRSELVSHTK